MIIEDNIKNRIYSDWSKDDVLPKDTILFPEIEALRYTISEQRKMIEELEDKLYHESRRAPEIEYKLGHEIEKLKAQLDVALDALNEIKDYAEMQVNMSILAPMQVPMQKQRQWFKVTDALYRIAAMERKDE